ncbi:MAG: ankyrin repeat domain-containing protein [Methyloprofundus sp.]|nr:ankyrin repeat domain-containing protein [Methyloprofundus sp.]
MIKLSDPEKTAELIVLLEFAGDTGHWLKGHSSQALYLINQGADINAQDRWGWDVLMHASYSGHIDSVIALIELGVNLKARESGYLGFN